MGYNNLKGTCGLINKNIYLIIDDCTRVCLKNN